MYADDNHVPIFTKVTTALFGICMYPVQKATQLSMSHSQSCRILSDLWHSLWLSNTALSAGVLAASLLVRFITDSILRYIWINSERWKDRTSWLVILTQLLSLPQTGKPEMEVAACTVSVVIWDVAAVKEGSSVCMTVGLCCYLPCNKGLLHYS